MPAMTCTLVEQLQTIADPRRQGENLKHPLVDLIILGFCGVLAGGEDFVEIAKWGKVNEAFFRTFLEFPHGIPSHDTFTRVFALLNPSTLQAVLLPWLLERRGLPGDWIHLDGKTLRRTRCQSQKLKALHVVSAWAGQTGITLGQVAVDAKSNEITAMPRVTETLGSAREDRDDRCDGVSKRDCARRLWPGVGTTSWRSKTISRPCTPRSKRPLRTAARPRRGPRGCIPPKTTATGARNSARCRCCPRAALSVGGAGRGVAGRAHDCPGHPGGVV